MGRTYHLRQTYLYNVALCLQYLDDFEFLLLNYNSPDDMDEWVQSDLSCFFPTGTVKYFKTTEPSHFHMSHAKNVIHRQATKDIVVNLDADNRLSIFYLYALTQLPPRHILYIAQDGRYSAENVAGRIALYRQDFLNLGGYDEHLSDGWGFDDDDLTLRATRSGMRARWLEPPVIGVPIPHTDFERTAHMKTSDKRASHYQAWLKSTSNLDNGILSANTGTPWGRVSDLQAISAHQSALPLQPS
jgi:hypothetical protein